MACQFSIPFSGSPNELVTRAKSAVQNQGGAFRGDENSGAFQISVMGNTIKGSYAVSGGQLVVSIDSKPFFIPCNTIEGFLRNQLR